MIFKQLNVARATEKGESYYDRKIMTEKEKFAEKYNNTLSKFSANFTTSNYSKPKVQKSKNNHNGVKRTKQLNLDFITL